eukprot:CAMPEP_0194393302 /NCGR_PEP_ID=MMETSP0174-20130528/123222_1 /TAXON_ID=216777 /ORGANISM="Proboscia alata, Strain PI-D3" /LENGTH=123 /DNA_ID=CAMNT_0039188971 /DNA_START=671 /DNA_END=1043 /DNA_ORIENTATION=+
MNLGRQIIPNSAALINYGARLKPRYAALTMEPISSVTHVTRVGWWITKGRCVASITNTQMIAALVLEKTAGGSQRAVALLASRTANDSRVGARENLRRVRGQQRVTQAEVSDSVGISSETYAG